MDVVAKVLNESLLQRSGSRLGASAAFSVRRSVQPQPTARVYRQLQGSIVLSDLAPPVPVAAPLSDMVLHSSSQQASSAADTSTMAPKQARQRAKSAKGKPAPPAAAATSKAPRPKGFRRGAFRDEMRVEDLAPRPRTRATSAKQQKAGFVPTIQRELLAAEPFCLQ
ncbi:hypothetical protein SS50377_23974 [Spironucleus salmonicida]|uniref:Uncharacterized protein n=1 Tax=Spironucleus salmonicida TaxID=348837 RepID=V6LEH8_9EUKA|nr:hypothetical protein SS50377_23974 [Spironucleus salmonicida]|eukprot:EST42920.1 Hypothetical protein SS50377_17453 [Spironucleus salmonicida]